MASLINLFPLFIILTLQTCLASGVKKTNSPVFLRPLIKDKATSLYYTNLNLGNINHSPLTHSLAIDLGGGSAALLRCNTYVKSTTYLPIRCNSAVCKQAKPDSFCFNKTNTCGKYVSTSFTENPLDTLLGIDSVSLLTSKPNGVTIFVHSPLTLSCPNDANALRLMLKVVNGTIGLGNSSFSLLSQLASMHESRRKLTLCLPSKPAGLGSLHIGVSPYTNDVSENLASTPLVIDQTTGEYFIDVMSIEIAGTVVPLGKKRRGNVMICTLAPYTVLEELSPVDVSALQLLSNNLESLFDTPESFYGDAKLILADEREVSFHRFIVAARSPFFKNALAAAAEKGPQKSTAGTKLELKNMATDYEVGFDSVAAVMAYIYSGRVRPPPKGVSDCADEDCRHVSCRPAVDFMVEVLYLAFLFQIPELVTMYQRHLLDVVDKVIIEDALVILKLANICGQACKKLFDKCTEIIVKSNVDIVTLNKSLPQQIVKQVIDIRKELGLEVPEPDKHVSNIHKALECEDLALVDLLLKEGYTNLDEAYALHFAVAYCAVETATELLKREVADVNRRNPRGYTVLHVAAMRKEPSLIAFLLTKGANASDMALDGRTALLIAKQVTKAGEYNCITEEGKDSPKGRLCVEILEQPENLGPFPEDASSACLALAPDAELKIRLIDFENREFGKSSRSGSSSSTSKSTKRSNESLSIVGSVICIRAAVSLAITAAEGLQEPKILEEMFKAPCIQNLVKGQVKWFFGIILWCLQPSPSQEGSRVSPRTSTSILTNPWKVGIHDKVLSPFGYWLGMFLY
ncbi:hypothetical protein DY000_02054357 [Brassica cretica]|uniref:BTB domain-containing protein n=1 Tax=Brassica cretica TaxID=69181 RepID=A0ABQ7AGH4_BRACR|nr:hypothetical protein DY000_02054357 [Brassica cretica]